MGILRSPTSFWGVERLQNPKRQDPGQARMTTKGLRKMPKLPILSGQEVIKVLKKITDPKEQLDSFMSFVIREFKTEIKNDEAIIISKSLPKEISKSLEEKITSLIPTIKKLAIKKE